LLPALLPSTYVPAAASPLRLSSQESAPFHAMH